MMRVRCSVSRLAVIVAVPFAIVSIFIIGIQVVVRRVQHRRLTSLALTSERLRAERAKLLERIKERTFSSTTRLKRRASSILNRRTCAHAPPQGQNAAVLIFLWPTGLVMAD